MTVRVRFAPSPTGFLHIGGARTALFNWLHARHTGGAFVLRVEDTDETRSTPESVEAIFLGMKWLGLDWDEGPTSTTDHKAHKGEYGPYFQIQRADLYKKYVQILIEKGNAYPCFCTPEEVQKMRDRALLTKRPPKYDGTCRRLTDTQRKTFQAEGRTFSVRFKSPANGNTVFDDVVRGPMKFENEIIEDFVIQKTSGIPTYNFACVVDDHEMKITHVIRGDDHLSNTPRQILACQALGWPPPPLYAHLSMILGADGTRLSKRHGATSIQEYEQAGYLPEAVRNYLALQGWSTEDSQQLFTGTDLVKKFTLERCGKSPGVFDPQKLLWMNGDYIRRMSVSEIVDKAMPFIKQAGFINGQEVNRRKEIEAAVALEHEKFKLLTDVPRLIEFFFKEVEFDAVAVEKVLKKPNVTEILREGADTFKTLEPFTAASTEEACKALAARRQIKNGAVYHPVRVSVSGRTQGPSLFHMLEVLGRDRVLKRIQNALQMLSN